MKRLLQKNQNGFPKAITAALIAAAAIIGVLPGLVSASYRIPAGITVNGITPPAPGHQAAQRIIVPAPVDTEWAYWISLPSTYDPNGTKLWPLLVWYGPDCIYYPNQDGNDINVFFKVGQENGGPARWMQDSLRANYTFMGDRFIIVSPYISRDIFNAQPQRLQGLHKYLKATYKVDPTRVYLTGGCRGGKIVFNYCEYDTLGIAAIVVMAFNDSWGGSTVDLTKACRTKYTWMKHYASLDDCCVPYQNQVAVHTALDNCHLTPRRDTLITFATGGHELWGGSRGVLKTQPAFDWLLTKVNTNVSTSIAPVAAVTKKKNCVSPALDVRLSPNDRMEIFDVDGKLVQRLSGNGSTAQQMIPNLNRGMYLVKIMNGNQFFARIVVAK